MTVLTGLSGNEMYCLKQKGYDAGNIVIGNSVFALGFVGSIGSGLSTLVGGEVTAVTQVIHDGRLQSYERMMKEVANHRGCGVTGISSDLVFHGTNIEFLSIGSTIHRENNGHNGNIFSASADGQSLFCQMDCGFEPIKFVFGNVAYSIGVGGGLLGSLRSLGRGEVKEYSDIFHKTRHLALERITDEARTAGANAVLGIQTSVSPLGAIQEMLMIGTASKHPGLSGQYLDQPISSDLTNLEMWNILNMGYRPVKLILGVSVYSLGVIGGISAALKGLVRGEISELTTLIYEARENALAKVSQQAADCGADDVVGIKTYISDLGGGILELMTIGTAVKKADDIKPLSPTLLTQAIVKDQQTSFKSIDQTVNMALNQPTRSMQNSFWVVIVFVIYFIFSMVSSSISHHMPR